MTSFKFLISLKIIVIRYKYYKKLIMNLEKKEIFFDIFKKLSE